ncbi:unnamed protein product, partial [Effrenium voratum]
VTLPDPCNPSAESSPPRALSGGAGGHGVLSDIALGAGAMACVCLIVANVNCSWVQSLGDEEKNTFNEQEAKQAFAAIPMIVVVNTAFNLCYNSMNNAFPSQACQMDVRLGTGQLNGAFYNVADALAIVVFTPIFESCLFPLIAR